MSVMTRAAAASYAELGWSVVAVIPGEKRTYHKWKPCQTQRADEQTIAMWWAQWPGANVGIVTGAISGLVVIEADNPDVEEAITIHGGMPETPTARSRRGCHYYLAHPGGRVKNATNLGGIDGLDVRGDGGIVVAPPSVHRSGAIYTWEIPPGEVPLAPIPAWLLDMMNTHPAEPAAGDLFAEDAEPTDDPMDAAMRGTRPPVSVQDLVRLLEQLPPARWANYDDWLHIGMALHHWGGRDDQRRATAFALFDQYSKERAPEQYGQTAQKWASFGKNGYVPVTLATLFTWTVPPATSANGAQPPPPDPPPAGSAPAAGPPPAATPAPSFHCTDLGNAQRFAFLHGHTVRYVPEWGKWYIWDGTRWGEDKLNAILQLARDIPRAIYQEAAAADDARRKDLGTWAIRSESRDALSAAAALLKTEHGIPVYFTALDADPWALNCTNGTLDLRTGELRPHRRSDLLTKQIPVAYDPAATCPRWLAFLDTIFKHDADLIAFIQRAVGYTLTADVSEQCIFFEYGTGKNGKSTFSSILQKLLGEYGQQAPSELILARRNDGIPADVARLVGARLAVTSELEQGQRLAESKVKDLTGGDRIVARFMRENWFEFAPTHKLWIYGNHKPVIRGSDEGIWRRIRLIPFAVTIPPEQRDPSLAEKLSGELPGILAWAVRGELDRQHHGLHEPRVVIEATAEYRAEMDRLGPYMEDRVLTGPRLSVLMTALYADYKLWCVDNDEEPVSKNLFGRMLTERGFGEGRDTRGGRTRTGLGLKPT